MAETAIISPVSSIPADFDQDGDLDVVFTSTRLNGWFENLGQGQFGPPIGLPDLPTGGRPVGALHAADLDGDNDLDLLIVPRFGGDLHFFENLDGRGSFAEPTIIKSPGYNPMAAVSDIDMDGRLDLVLSHRECFQGSCSHVVGWRTNQGDGSFAPWDLITVQTNVDSLDVVDIDSNGRPDLVLGYFRCDVVQDDCHYEVGWYENSEDRGVSSTVNPIISLPAEYLSYRPSRFHIGDLNGDGDNDVVIAVPSANYLGWAENVDGVGSFSTLETISTAPIYDVQLDAGDIDNDGDQDIVVSSYSNTRGQLNWFENVDGKFDEVKSISENDQASQLAIYDMNGDGQDDIQTSSFESDAIQWYSQTDGSFESTAIAAHAERVQSMRAVDLDNDGDQDLLLARQLNEGQRESQIMWMENVGGMRRFTGHVITSATAGVAHANDLDGDGDLDLITSQENWLVWLENINGEFQNPTRIVSDDRTTIHTADIDNDGDIDILSDGGDVTWLENSDGLGEFVQHGLPRLSARYTDFQSMSDFDQDGDLDILYTTGCNAVCHRELAWLENRGPEGFIDHTIFSGRSSNQLAAASGDIDGDGDSDIVRVGSSGAKLFRNQGDGDFAGDRDSVSSNLGQLDEMWLIDLDGDGDLDVAGESGHSAHVLWYENVDGEGAFSEGRTIQQRLGFLYQMAFGDFDLDGDVDLVTATFSPESITLLENRPVGDANADGIFNSSDLVAVFIAGEYEDGFDGNSSFGEGDWNGDGDFDTADLVAAFSAGSYDASARSTAHPQSVDAIFEREARIFTRLPNSSNNESREL